VFGLCDDLLHDVPRDIRQPEVAAVVLVGELLVIHPHECEDGCVEIVDADFVDSGLVADLIGFAVVGSAADAAAGHPRREGVGIVIAAGLGTFLGQGEAAELAGADDQGAVEEAALFQICQQSGDRDVRFAGELAVIAGDIDMAIPRALVFHSAAEDLDEAHAALDETGAP